MLRNNSEGVKLMTLAQYYDKQIPDYYDGMYLDGYTPAQIRHAAVRKILKRYYAR